MSEHWTLCCYSKKYAANFITFFFVSADFGSQDFYDIPRPFPTDKSYSFDFNENLKCYFVSVAATTAEGYFCFSFTLIFITYIFRNIMYEFVQKSARF